MGINPGFAMACLTVIVCLLDVVMGGWGGFFFFVVVVKRHGRRRDAFRWYAFLKAITLVDGIATLWQEMTGLETCVAAAAAALLAFICGSVAQFSRR